MLPQSDRMGARLSGERVTHARGHDIISDGIALGSIQIPGDGLPIVLLVDRQTTGGYTKVATVCSFDIGRVGQVRPGQSLPFRPGLAEVLTRRVPSVEQIRFTNSGTEGTMNAVRLARACTGRPKIAKFEGASHGTHEWVLVSVAPDPKAAGSRKRPKPLPASAGIPPAVLKHTVVLPWNDGEACEAIIEAEAKHLAAVIVDPLLGIGGVIPPVDGFLQRLRALTERHGIVLIFDEVISFRIAWGGAQERFGVRPDLTTFGKIIGGGLPVGAFGGRADIMSYFDPRKGAQRISHGGTFNANPATMAAGVATLNALTPEAYARLDALGERLRGGVARLLAATRRKGQVSGVGSLFCLDWTAEPLTDYRSSRPRDPVAPLRHFTGLLNEVILPTQRGLGAWSLEMTVEDIDRFVNALARVTARSQGR